MTISDTQRAILTAAARHPEQFAILPDRLPAAAQSKVATALLKADLVAVVDRRDGDTQALGLIDGEAMLLKFTAASLAAIGADADDGRLSPEEFVAEQDLAQRAHDAGIDPTAPYAHEQAVALGLVPGEGATAAAGDSDSAAGTLPRKRQGAARKPHRPTLRSVPWRRAGRRSGLPPRPCSPPRDAAPDRSGLEDAVEALRRALDGKAERTPRQPGAVGVPRKPREGTK